MHQCVAFDLHKNFLHVRDKCLQTLSYFSRLNMSYRQSNIVCGVDLKDCEIPNVTSLNHGYFVFCFT